ncbi:uncharacterized protein I206_105685 [Kwoniella pini CBS 10737]|uniref:LsmAD domain-containing protein n=1 Tax=Kwoniella pini CBS 10737 TaxID=1296096 RepID=A0A1B9I3J3_9TREE|nr:uncharacterized protein I206_03412 [Kwoniella pini CBS 10737]OCF50095.1 hypothetical protein I206_03412 [Kwoniella pini CBS 10737]
MSINERGGRGGNRGGTRGGRGGADSFRGRGVWRGGPPPGSISRGSSPAVPSSSGSPAPRQSINDHMNDMKKIAHDDKARQGKGFQTDTDISKSSGPVERELKPWVPDATSPPPSNGPAANGSAARDQDTFGTLVTGVPWDQFETNERLFGAKTDYQEELYTTKLNKNGVDYKRREKEADKLANEIMGTVTKNTHIQEERGLQDSTKDEEEKYSGVVRAPGSYVPPGARKSFGQGGSVPRISAPTGPAAPKTNGSTAPPSAGLPPKPLSPAPPPAAAVAVVPPPNPRSTSEDPSTTVSGATAAPAALPAQPAEAPAIPTVTAPADQKTDGQLGGVVDQWRQFVGTERERAEAKKQSHMKTERERQLADLKNFHANFKVPLPMPKDILPILAKDESKQKDIEAKAANQLEKAKEDRKTPAGSNSTVKSPIKSSAPMEQAKTDQPAAKNLPPKKPFMKIPEIPPFNPANKRTSALPTSTAAITAGIEKIAIAETANQNIPQQSNSPTPSMASLASASQAKLNPKANTFVFKPSAAVFKPGQSSASPANVPRQLPAVTSSVSSPAPAVATLKNPFFKDKVPEKVSVDVRNDFNPWKHGSGSVPSASTVGLQWPYPGRKSHIPSFNAGGPFGSAPVPPHFAGPGGPGSVFDDETNGGSPSPHPPNPMVGGMQPYPGYGYRFNQPGVPPQFSGQMNSPMFSPGGPQFAPPPGQAQHQQQQHHPMIHGGGPGPQANGMPMYFQSGMPQNPQFIPPQHMQFNPHTPQRHGPGPGQGPGGPGGYYSHQNVSTPHQTPQMVPHNLPQFQQQPQQFHAHPHSPMQVNQSHPGGPQQQGPPSGQGSGPGSVNNHNGNS